MKLLESVAEMKVWSKMHPSIGFVPTMGALHDGHLALVARSRRENKHTVVSIFVNPTQFNDPNDLAKYPRPIKKDLALLKEADVDAVFLPKAEEFYADQYRYRVSENQLSQILCGASRPGHFEGVLTVVLKLLQSVQANKAYFGEKDYQQFLLIRDMAKAFFLNTEIIPCPTVREADGLAMSSRNQLLSPSDREKASLIFKVLLQAPSADAAAEELELQGFRVDYVKDEINRRFAAAFLGKVRLIDNVEL